MHNEVYIMDRILTISRNFQLPAIPAENSIMNVTSVILRKSDNSMCYRFDFVMFGVNGQILITTYILLNTQLQPVK